MCLECVSSSQPYVDTVLARSGTAHERGRTESLLVSECFYQQNEVFSQVKRGQHGMPRGPSPHLWSCVSFVNMIADVGQVCLCRLCVTMGRETAGSHRREGAAHEKGLGARERFSSLSPSFALRLPSCMHVLCRQQRPALLSSSSPHRRRIGCGISGI